MRFVLRGREEPDALDESLWSEPVEDDRVLLHSTQKLQVTLELASISLPYPEQINMEYVSDFLETSALDERKKRRAYERTLSLFRITYNGI